MEVIIVKGIKRSIVAISLCFLMILGSIATGGNGILNMLDVVSFKASANNSEYNVGDIIEFGSYPQKKVEDEKKQTDNLEF